jgi:hypothetical protein
MFYQIVGMFKVENFLMQQHMYPSQEPRSASGWCSTSEVCRSKKSLEQGHYWKIRSFCITLHQAYPETNAEK